VRMYVSCIVKHMELILRLQDFNNVYGPHEITEGEWAAVIGKWRGLIAEGKPIQIVGDGEQRRDFTHIDDIVEGLIKIGFSNKKHIDAWELGTGFNYSLNEVADMFVEKFGCEKVYIPQQKGNYTETNRVNDDAINELGWAPKDILNRLYKKSIKNHIFLSKINIYEWIYNFRNHFSSNITLDGTMKFGEHP